MATKPELTNMESMGGVVRDTSSAMTGYADAVDDLRIDPSGGVYDTSRAAALVRRRTIS